MVPTLVRHDLDVNGIRLHVTETGEGPSVVFCHGFPDTSRTWLRQMTALSAAGYRTIAPDMRGYGGSSAPEDPRDYTPLSTVGDLVAMLDELGIATATIVGHDWGAFTAWHAALMRPDRFTAVAGLSVHYTPRGRASLLDLMRARGLDSFYMFDFIARADAGGRMDPVKSIAGGMYWGSGAPPPGERWSPFDRKRGFGRPVPLEPPAFVDPAYLNETIAAFERTGFLGGLNYYRAIQPFFEMSSAFSGAKIYQPSFYVNGLADGLNELKRPTTEEVRTAAPGLWRHVEFEGVGHWVQHEAPERLNALLLEFLRHVAETRPRVA